MCSRPLRVALFLLCAGAAACERAPEAPPERAAVGTPADPAARLQPPPAAEDSLYPVEIEPGIAVAVRRTGSRAYTVYGATDRTSMLRMEVEDGHNILFGPADVPVRDQRFRIDLTADPTDRDHIFLYIEDAEQERLAVVPIDTARSLTTAGPAALLPEPPAPDHGDGAAGREPSRD